jgi:hypothetical protein
MLDDYVKCQQLIFLKAWAIYSITYHLCLNTRGRSSWKDACNCSSSLFILLLFMPFNGNVKISSATFKCTSIRWMIVGYLQQEKFINKWWTWA